MLEDTNSLYGAQLWTTQAFYTTMLFKNISLNKMLQTRKLFNFKIIMNFVINNKSFDDTARYLATSHVC